jgi:hypothetical protein
MGENRSFLSFITHHLSRLSPVSHRKIQKFEQGFVSSKSPLELIPVECCPYVKGWALFLPGIGFAIMQEFCRALRFGSPQSLAAG